MKTNSIFKFWTAVFMTCVISGCDPEITDDAVIEPVFPESITKSVEAGETVEISFIPNVDWSVSVPLESLRWFWIDNDGVTTDQIAGSATSSTVTVKIKVADDIEFDESRSCTVSMTMGDRTESIAFLTRKAADRTLDVFTAIFSDGTFATDSTGIYIYNDTAAGSMEMHWSAVDADFRLPVMVDSNCEWTVDCPDGIDVNLPESTKGLVEVVFIGESFEALTDEIVFLSGESEITRLPVSLPSCSGMAAYGVVVEDGAFIYAEEGGYLYSEEPVSDISLIWSGTDFRIALRVDSKCNWTLELPEWLTVDLPDKRAGVTEFTLKGNPSKYPMTETTAPVSFMFDDEEIYRMNVTIPGVAGHMEYSLGMSLTSLEFSPAGEFLTSSGYVDGPATGSYTSTRNARIIAVETTGGAVTEEQDWLSVNPVTSWNIADGAAVLQTMEFEISASENTSDERTAVIFFLPESVTAASSDLFEAGEVKPEYAGYALQVLQHGSDMEFVTMLTPSEMASAGAEFQVSTNPRLKTYFGSTADTYTYELTYTDRYARDKAHMSFSRPFASYRVFNAARVDKTVESQTDSLYWLKFTPSSDDNTGGVIDMYNGTAAITGYIAFYGIDGSTIAVIQCDYDPSVNLQPDVVVEFTELSQQYADMVGASLVQLTSGNIYNAVFHDDKTPIYHLKYTMENMPLKIKIPSNVLKHTVGPYGYRNFFKVNGVIYDEYFGPNDILSEIETDDEGAVEISMSKPDDVLVISDKIPLAEDEYMALIYFNDKSDAHVFILVCTLDLSGSVE
ncbi:MAG: hypothetical protein IJ005_08895 [Bacteroidales bacterium]|nr:hypothetical protein [Bacteroidales bacterium]